MGPSSNKKNELVRLAQQAGQFTAIPMILVGGPTLGFLVGSYLDRRFSIGPWGTGIGVILGLVAGLLETIQLIRTAQKSEESSGHDS